MNYIIVLALSTILAISVVQSAYAQVSSTTRYHIGYNDGCNGLVVPGRNTEAYLLGYIAGAQACNPDGSVYQIKQQQQQQQQISNNSVIQK